MPTLHQRVAPSTTTDDDPRAWIEQLLRAVDAGPPSDLFPPVRRDVHPARAPQRAGARVPIAAGRS